MATPVLAARWFEALILPDTSLRAAIVRRAMADIGIEEDEANRSGYIDTVLRAAKTDVGQPWCAAAVRQWFDDAGAMFPRTDAAAVAAWVGWAKATGAWREDTYAPLPGDAVVYLHSHIGVVARVHRRGARAVEGNTSFAGFSREGIVCDYKPIVPASVRGYIVPTARAA